MDKTIITLIYGLSCAILGGVSYILDRYGAGIIAGLMIALSADYFANKIANAHKKT